MEWKTLRKYAESMKTSLNLGNHEDLQDKIFKKLKSLLCKFYGFKSSTLVNEVRKCIFLSKFEKPKRSFDHLKLHINRENYVTIIFKCANTL